LWLLTLSQMTRISRCCGWVAEHVLQEGDELLAGVARGGLAEDLAGGGVQCREQAQSACIRSLTLGASGGQRQHPILRENDTSPNSAANLRLLQRVEPSNGLRLAAV
jgi:hypothetical protein